MQDSTPTESKRATTTLLLFLFSFATPLFSFLLRLFPESVDQNIFRYFSIATHLFRQLNPFLPPPIDPLVCFCPLQPLTAHDTTCLPSTCTRTQPPTRKGNYTTRCMLHVSFAIVALIPAPFDHFASALPLQKPKTKPGPDQPHQQLSQLTVVSARSKPPR